MKVGKTLSQLAAEIERQSGAKQDLIANTAGMRMIVDEPNKKNRIVLGDQYDFGINDVGHEQIGGHLQIPRPYYERMRANSPDLLAENVNHWLREKPEQRMVRTMDKNVRAFLSNAYRPMENADLAQAVLPVLANLKCHVLSCEVTDRRMYIKAVDRSITRHVELAKLGTTHDRIKDLMCPIISISNSEVGCGSMSVETGVWTEGCTNLLVMQQRSMRKYHVGRRADIGEEMFALLSDQTRRLSDAALWAQTRDVVKAAFEKAVFDATVDRIQATTDDKIGKDADVTKVVEVARRKLDLTETEGRSVLQHLIRGGDLSKYGLLNAITRTAEDLDSYDRASELERIGGRVIELPKTDWLAIAEAA